MADENQSEKPLEQSLEDSLTHKQRAFCLEYMRDLNGTQAAIRSGYSEHTAGSIATENLQKPYIKAFIQELMDERSERLELTADKVLRDIEEIKKRCMQGEPVKDKEGQPTGEWKFESTSALKACELIGRHLKMFTDKVEHSGKMSVELSDEQLDHRLNELLKKDQP